MNSSISSSDPVASPWPRFAQVLAGTALALLVGILALAVLLDPYDTGRPGLIDKPGLRPQGPRTAGASRGRDLSFNAVILGNSHVQLLSPERLGPQTKARFVSLTVPGTGPKEQLLLLDWFMRHRTEAPKALVFGIDSKWCVSDSALANDKPFPFWLYERSSLAYAAGLLRYDTLEELPRRIGYLLRSTPERAAPDGYWDYAARFRQGTDDDGPRRGVFLGRYQPDIPANTTGQFPASVQLSSALAALPTETRVILVHPPTYVTALPAPGSVEETTSKACKAAFATVARQRSGTAVIDWQQNMPDARDPALWFDHTHYDQPLAIRIEASIAATLQSLE
jgi:hypothetical protein